MNIHELASHLASGLQLRWKRHRLVGSREVKTKRVKVQGLGHNSSTCLRELVAFYKSSFSELDPSRDGAIIQYCRRIGLTFGEYRATYYPVYKLSIQFQHEVWVN